MLCPTDLQWSVFGFWKFSFIQALPALEELLDDGAVRADDLEACDVGSTRKDPVQAHVGKTLRAKSKTGWWWSIEKKLKLYLVHFEFCVITALSCNQQSLTTPQTACHHTEQWYCVLLLRYVELFHVAGSYQVGEDVVVSSAVLSWGHHLQVAAGDAHSESHLMHIL